MPDLMEWLGVFVLAYMAGYLLGMGGYLLGKGMMAAWRYFHG